MSFLKVKMQMNQAARDWPQLASRLKSITASTINKVATAAERDAIKTVARDIKLPEKYIRNRFTRGGEIKERRTEIRRASPWNLTASLSVYMRGLPVYQVAGIQIKRPGGGVKAKGGRFYQGAFKAQGVVFKRIGRDRTPLMMPKIGLRERLTKEFDRNISGAEGLARFRREYAMQLNRAASRYGVRA